MVANQRVPSLSCTICRMSPKSFIAGLKSSTSPPGVRTSNPPPPIHRLPFRSSNKGIEAIPPPTGGGSFVSIDVAFPPCQRIKELAPAAFEIQSRPFSPTAKQVMDLPPPPSSLTVGTNSNPLNRTRLLDEPTIPTQM